MQTWKYSQMFLGKSEIRFLEWICIHVLEHIPNDRAAIGELYRVLKPGGRMMTGFCNPFFFVFDYSEMEKGNLVVRHRIPYSDFENLSEEEIETKIAAHKLEHSLIGVAGKAIEPVIQPLGYDWKIGIAIICSFAAREVFVGTWNRMSEVEPGLASVTTKKI